MKILIVAATRNELAGFCLYFNLPDEDFIQTPLFDLLFTGVGMTATAFALGQNLPNSYHMVVNMGIAGCYDRNIPLGTLLNITKDTFAELGAEDHDEFLPVDRMGFGKSSYLQKYTPDFEQLTHMPQVSGITVNRVHGNAESIRQITERLHPVTESMEGAAVFYCCAQLGIPCLQVRSISNYVEPRNRAAWQIDLALKNLNEWAIDFLTNY